MRVAFDARYLVRPVLRGMDRYLIELTRSLSDRGVQITLLHPAAHPPHAAHLEGLGCSVQAVPGRGLRFDQIALPRALGRGSFDLFHAPAEHGVPLRSPIPTVLTIHSATAESFEDLIQRGTLPGRLRDYLGRDLPRLGAERLYWHTQIRAADQILTPSTYAQGEVVRLLGVDPGRVRTTRLGLPLAFTRSALAPPGRAALLERLGLRPPFLLFVGSYETHKNVPGLLAAFERVRRDRPDVSLALAGGGPPPPTLARRLGPGVVPLPGLGPELVDLYDAAELLVTLSWRETFCLPALEALARGTFVVASAWGAAPEVVGAFGRLVDPREPALAAKAIRDLLARPPEPAERAAAIAWARAFTWSETAEATLSGYRRLLG